MPAHPTWHPRMLMHPTRHPRMPHASHTASTYASCTPHGIHVCPTHHTLHPRMPPPHFPHGIHAYPRAPHASSPPHTPRATLTTQTSAPTHACAPTLRAPHIPTCLHHPRHHLPLHRTTLHTTGNAIEHTTPNPLTPIQLNKKLEDMTAALSRAAPNPSQNRLAQSRAKSGRYQPYHISPATEPAGRTYDDPARNNRTSSGKKGKVGGTSASSFNDHSFTAGTDARGLSACAICLGRNPHDVTQCDSSVLWDGHTPSFARRGDKGAKLRSVNTGDSLCLDFNLPKGCNSASHLSRHRCSGCGNNDHAAQSCRLAQPKF